MDSQGDVFIAMQSPVVALQSTDLCSLQPRPYSIEKQQSGFHSTEPLTMAAPSLADIVVSCHTCMLLHSTYIGMIALDGFVQETCQIP